MRGLESRREPLGRLGGFKERRRLRRELLLCSVDLRLESLHPRLCCAADREEMLRPAHGLETTRLGRGSRARLIAKALQLASRLQHTPWRSVSTHWRIHTYTYPTPAQPPPAAHGEHRAARGTPRKCHAGSRSCATPNAMLCAGVSDVAQAGCSEGEALPAAHSADHL